MTTLNPVQQPQPQSAPSTQDAQQARDPFLRKNQPWFHQPLPPSIERPWLAITDPTSQNHLDQITTRTLDLCQSIERSNLVPRSHAQQLENLRKKILTLINQTPETDKLITAIQNEIALAQDFYAQRTINTPC